MGWWLDGRNASICTCPATPEVHASWVTRPRFRPVTNLLCAFQSYVINPIKTLPVPKLRILVITSCTGEKALLHERQPTLADFRKGQEHIRALERSLSLVRADELYTGLQHQRLMRGVVAARQSHELAVDLHVLSAGYGLVSAEQPLAPYEATFAGMKKDELLGWARQLHVATDC